VSAEIRRRHVPAELDAAEETKARVRGNFVEGRGDGLDLLVIGRHAGADEAVRRGHPVEEIDLDDAVLVLQQMVGGVEAGRARADDRDPQRSIVRSKLAHGSADSNIATDGTAVVSRFGCDTGASCEPDEARARWQPEAYVGIR
jgi:hypothetical protein